MSRHIGSHSFPCYDFVSSSLLLHVPLSSFAHFLSLYFPGMWIAHVMKKNRILWHSNIEEASSIVAVNPSNQVKNSWCGTKKTTAKTLALHSTTSGRKNAPQMVTYNPDLYYNYSLPFSLQRLLYRNASNNDCLHQAVMYSTQFE